MKSPPRTTAERQRDYVKRLNAAGKTHMTIIVRTDVARKLHELSRVHVEPLGDVLAKALRALEEAEALASQPEAST